jgi:hypothetical protein
MVVFSGMDHFLALGARLLLPICLDNRGGVLAIALNMCICGNNITEAMMQNFEF